MSTNKDLRLGEGYVESVLARDLPSIARSALATSPLVIRLEEKDRVIEPATDIGTPVTAPVLFQSKPDSGMKLEYEKLIFQWVTAGASIFIPNEILGDKEKSAARLEEERCSFSIEMQGAIDRALFLGPQGLRNAISDMSTYAGIDRSQPGGASPSLRSCVNTTGGYLTLDLLDKAIGQSTIGNDSPDFSLMPVGLFEELSDKANTQQQMEIAQEKRTLLTKRGHRVIWFQGVAFVAAPFLWEEVYFLNSDYIRLSVSKFDLQGPYPRQRDGVWGQFWRGSIWLCLQVQSPRLCAKLTNLTGKLTRA